MSKVRSILSVAFVAAVSAIAIPAQRSAAWANEGEVSSPVDSPLASSSPMSSEANEIAGTTSSPNAIEASSGSTESVAPSGKSAPLEHGLTAPIRVAAGAGIVYLPAGFAADRDGAFDLVVHFHGDALVIEPEFARAGLKA